MKNTRCTTAILNFHSPLVVAELLISLTGVRIVKENILIYKVSILFKIFSEMGNFVDEICPFNPHDESKHHFETMEKDLIS